MLTTRQYREIFTEVAAKHGIDWVGTWTDTTTGRGYTIPGQDLRHVTHDIGHNDPKAVSSFIRELTRHPLVTEGNNIRLTSYYVKATCVIHDDLWHSDTVQLSDVADA